MSKSVVLDANNQASAFYDSVINAGAIPSGAVAISDALWQQWIANTAGFAYQASTQTLVAVAPPFATLQAQVSAAAGAAAAAVVAAIYPTASAEAALQSAANIVLQSANAAPASTSPFFASFNALAAGYGLSPANFAALAVTAMTQSLALHSAEVALAAAVAAAATAAQLATALAAFETAIGGVVAALNAQLPAPIAAPPAISIAGVNS